MTLPELSIRRHVLAYMMSGVLMLLGYIGYTRLGIDRFPQIEFPVITIMTVMPGANPNVMDSNVTSVIESAVNSVPGINHIQSTSSPGVSVVVVEFSLSKNADVAFNEVQAKVNQILRQLPKGIDNPVVAKVEVGAQPVMWLSLNGDRTLGDMNLYARNVIKKRLENIDGVGQVLIGGERKRQIRVNLNLAALAGLGLSVNDVLGAFEGEHVVLPGGFLSGSHMEFLIKLDAEFHNLNDMRGMIVGYKDNAPIFLREVARVEDGLADYRQLANFNGKPNVGLGIVKVSRSNTIEVIEKVQERLKNEIIPQLPPGLAIEEASNDGLFIRGMVNSLKEHIVESVMLAALVVFLFLKSFRATFIIATAIPVSLLSAIAAMYFSGYTFNTLTLLALLLLIGVVVDDAIVVLENIYRHREHIDRDPVSASINGSQQVVFAVLAATLTLISIFFPVIFMGGIIGRFFQSFAVVVTVGVIASWFVSMTLTPMLCSRFLVMADKETHGPAYRFLDRAFLMMDRWYIRLLEYALSHRWKVVLFTAATVLSTGFFFAMVGKEFVPKEDEGRFIVFFKTPLGSSIDYAAGRLAEVEKVMAGQKEILTYFTAIGLGQAGQVNQGMAFVRLTPKAERKLKQYEVMDALAGKFARIPGVMAFPSAVPMVSGGRGEPLQFTLSGVNLDQVAALAEQMKKKLSADGALGRLDLDLQTDMPQVNISIDRARAATLGLSAIDMAMAVNVLVGGYDAAKYNDEPGDGERYDVRIKAADGQVENPADLKKIYVRSRDGKLVRLDTIASFKKELGPAVIGRLDLKYAANFFSDPAIPLGEAMKKVTDAADAILPMGYTVLMRGQAEEFGKTVGYMIFAFSMSIILLYMVLASQFNSFTQPFIIMVAQPLAIIGGLAALWITGSTLNIFSMIGLVLLMGLVAKNSILLVDFANQLRAEGKDIDAALREACPVRMRPVLMTSFTVIFAMLPAALGLGEGSDTNAPLSIAVIGGMISSTFLTLLVVPSVYSLAERWFEKRAARRRQPGPRPL
ncbi:MAG: efflux RND transporter permease subunit [Nitrospinae bacterium]|nr:efflux RND transporter permease subunit [Nitrospinota bacterium]